MRLARKQPLVLPDGYWKRVRVTIPEPIALSIHGPRTWIAQPAGCGTNWILPREWGKCFVASSVALRVDLMTTEKTNRVEARLMAPPFETLLVLAEDFPKVTELYIVNLDNSAAADVHVRAVTPSG